MKLRHTVIALLAGLPALAAHAAPPADNSGPWTGMDVSKLCHHRISQSGKIDQFARCLERHASRIGTPKQPGEVTELNNADAMLAQKAAKRAATEQPATEEPSQ